MNKTLHALVYVFLALAGAALFFEIQLNGKRTELTKRNRLQEDFLVKIAKTIEKAEPDKSAAFEVQKDASPVEAKIVDVPEMANLLDEYPAPLEQQNIDTYNWDQANVRQQLRTIYLLDPDGNPVMDGSEPQTHGPGTADELLNKLFESAKAQQSRLNSTRAALTELRGKLEAVVGELNKFKPGARQDKVAVFQLNDKIAKLEAEKAELENQITKQKSKVDELSAEVTSLKDEVQTAKDETEAAKEEVEKQKKLIDKLNSLLKEAPLTAGVKSERTAVTSLSAGDKGKIVEVDNANMFAVVEFSDDAMDELKGKDRRNALPRIELALRRTGFDGAAGEFVGRIRLRQDVKGKNYVVCDILGSWEQDAAKVGDIVFAD